MSENTDVLKAYKRLATKVVLDAAREYKKIFTRYLKVGKDRRRLGLEGRKKLDSCTLFFESQWCDALSDSDGKMIKKRIEKLCYKKLGMKFPE